MRDPELVARAQHAAARLETAWERWRSLQGMAETPAQPVVGYVGYALKEPWGQPRAVIGFSADEAERLAEFLEHDNADAQQPPRLPAYSVPQPMRKPSGTGPQPTFTPQPKFTPQTATPPAVQPLAQPVAQQVAQPSAPPVVPPPAARRQSGQRPQSRHARGSQPKTPRAAGSDLASEAKQAPDAAEEPGKASKGSNEPLHAASVPEQSALVEAAADRS